MPWPWPVFREIWVVLRGIFFLRNIAKYSALSEFFLAPEKNSREMWLHRAKFSYGGSKFSYGGLVTCNVPLAVPVPQVTIQRLNSYNPFIRRLFCHMPSST